MRDLTMQELAAVAGGQVGNSNAFSRAANSISVRQTNVARSGDAYAASSGTGSATATSGYVSADQSNSSSITATQTATSTATGGAS